MTKRGRQHIDRNLSISEARKVPNVSKNAIAIECCTSDKNRSSLSLERHFTHKIVANDDPNMLVALPLANGICVLCINDGISNGKTNIIIENQVELFLDKNVTSNINLIEFREGWNAEFTGKKKKGSVIAKAGTEICTITFNNTKNDNNNKNNNEVIKRKFCTPIGGQVLEFNQNLFSNPSLIHDQPYGSGYIAIIFPNTDIPTLLNPTFEDLMKEINKPQICYGFIKGTCIRGSNCKFSHIEPEESPSFKNSKLDERDNEK